jgi:hypothetical protein
MGIPQDWAPYSSVEDAAKVYLRDPDLALDQLRSVIDLSAIKSFIMSRGSTEESWGEPLWQEVVLTDGHRLIMWRADDELSTADDRERRVLNASVRTILLSTITDHVLTAEYEVLGDDTRRLSEVRLRMYTQLVTRSRQKSATEPTSTVSRSATRNRSTTAASPRCNAFCSSDGCCRDASSSPIRRRRVCRGIGGVLEFVTCACPVVTGRAAAPGRGDHDGADGVGRQPADSAVRQRR